MRFVSRSMAIGALLCLSWSAVAVVPGDASDLTPAPAGVSATLDRVLGDRVGTPGTVEPVGTVEPRRLDPAVYMDTVSSGQTIGQRLDGPLGASFDVRQPRWLGARFALDGDSVREGHGSQGWIDVSAGDLANNDDSLDFHYDWSLMPQDDARSRGFGLGYSFPWRYSTWRVDARRYHYEDRVVGSGSEYDVSGNQLELDVSGRKHLFSVGSTRLDGRAGLSMIEDRYVVDESFGDSSRRRLSVVEVASELEHAFAPDVRMVTRLSARSGIEVLGGEDDWYQGVASQARFNKYTVYSALQHPIWRWQWGVSGRYQFTSDALPASERITVASPSMMTGLNGQSLSADRGGWVRFDADSPRVRVRPVKGLYSSVTLSFLKGWVPYEGPRSDQFGSASAAEITVEFEGNGLSADLRIGRMLDTSPGIATMPDLPEISLSTSLSL